MLDFSPGVPLSREAYERRRDSTTRVELAKLLVSPEFKSWQEERTRPAPVHWEVVGGAALLALALVCTCVVVVVGPPASSPSGTASAALPVPSLAALPPPVSAGLEQAMGFSNQSVCSSNLLHALEIPAELQQVQDALQQERQLLRRQLRQRTSDLRRMQQELDEALDLSSDLWLRTAAVRRPDPAAIPAAAPPAASSLAMQPAAGLKFANSTASYTSGSGLLFSTWADKPAAILLLQASTAPIMAGSLAAVNGHLLSMLGAAALLLGLLGYRSLQARLRRLRSTSEELQRQLVAAAARLEDTEFAKETAEQSLQLLEQELQRKVKQVDDMARAAAQASAAASPLSMASDPSSPFTPTAAYAPGRGELPPPPGQLVEKFLRERNAVAVEEGQLQEWLVMEEEYARMRQQLAALAEQRAGLEQLAAPQTEQAQHLKEWLGVAQQELLTTQSQLQESEAEVRRLTAQLEAARQEHGGAAGAEGAEGEAEAVAEARASQLEQNLKLVAELQKHAAAFEALQAQFSSAQRQLSAQKAEGLRAAAEAQCALAEAAGAEPLAAAGGSAQEMEQEVDSMIELMRATRQNLASRLNHSQEVCAQTISGLSRLVAKPAPQWSSPAAAAAAVVQAEQGCSSVPESLLRSSSDIIHSPPVSLSGSHEGNPVRQQQPAGAAENSTPTASGGTHFTAALAAADVTAGTPASASVPTNFTFTALPSKRTPTPRKVLAPRQSVTPAGGAVLSATKAGPEAEGSLRKTREAAKHQVRAIRAQYSNFELGAFLARLGAIRAAPTICTTRAEFGALKEQGIAALKAKAADGKTTHERALAGEAVAVLQEWAYLQPVKAPPQSPQWWSRISLAHMDG